MGISLSTNNKFKYNADSATTVRKHCHENEHECAIENFDIVDHAKNKNHLRLKESLLISSVNPSLINVQQKSLPLSLFEE